MVPGVEADDVIGTLARMAAKRRHATSSISTGDKDLAQLVDEHVTLVNTMSNETLDVAGVTAKFGVPPERIVDYLTLIGDTVDNVPGVDKVGPKTAVKWLARVRLARRRDRARGARSRARSARTCARRSTGCRRARKLLTVETDCDLDGARPRPGRRSTTLASAPQRRRRRCARFYERFGFKAWCESSRRTTCRRELIDASDQRRRRPARPLDEPDARGRTQAIDLRLRDRARRWKRSTPGWRRLEARRARGVRHRDRLARPDARAARRHLAFASSRARRPTSRWRTLRRRARAAAARRGARAAQALAGGPGAAEARPERQVRRTCSPTTASTLRGYRARHAAADLRARSAQAARPGQPGASATSAARRIDLRRRVRQGRAPDPVRPGRRSTRATEYAGEDADMTLHAAPRAVAAASRPTRSCASSTRRSRCR